VIRQNVIQTATGIVLFYPGRLLVSQIRDWAQRHGGCRAAVSFERTLPGIRRWLRRAELAVIDATEDPAQATDAFLQSVGVLRADAVAVYTERMHDGLELLVRSLGVPLLFGPMSTDEWDEFLEIRFPSFIPLESAETTAVGGKHAGLATIREQRRENIVYYRPIAG
jgi:hypothetical protein